MNSTRPYHIGFIVPFLFRHQRGIERACINLANALVAAGQQVTLMAWDQPGRRTASPLDLRIRIVTVPHLRYYRAYWAVPYYAYELIKSRYDVVNVFFAGYGEAYSIRLARLFRRFQTNFIVGYPCPEHPYRFQEFRTLKLEPLLDRVVVKSPAMAPSVGDFFERAIQVIPNGIDVAFFDPQQQERKAIREELGLISGDKVLLTVAALEERKGIQHVIRALPLLKAAGYPAHYVVVGAGRDRFILEALAIQSGVSDRVHFVGQTSNVQPYYAAADIFLLPSYGEGFPNVLLEAWAMALPVIVSKHPPYPDIVPAELGTLVDEQATEELAIAVKSWLDQPERCRQIGARARDYVARHYSWQGIAAKYLKLYSGAPITGVNWTAIPER